MKRAVPMDIFLFSSSMSTELGAPISGVVQTAIILDAHDMHASPDVFCALLAL